MYIEYMDSPIGSIEITADDENICSICFCDIKSAENPSALTNKAAEQLREYFDGERIDLELPLKMYGTEFQKKIWNAMREIPYGYTASYRDIAAMAGNIKAVRAAGTAISKNKLLIAIPCHRIIRSDGSIGGYSCGLDKKIALMEIEKIKGCG